jgi:hypothetical protein
MTEQNTLTTEQDKLKELYDTKGIPNGMKQAVSFLRQWLNEDRKCEPMVTTKELWHWLEEAYIEDRNARAREVKGILQGTLYGYDLLLMAPEEMYGEIINENTLSDHLKNSNLFHGIDLSGKK